jgi:SnoaL-like domain
VGNQGGLFATLFHRPGLAGLRRVSEIIGGRGEAMSREEKVSVVEAYLDCFTTKDLSKISFAEDVTFEGPRMPKLAGRATVLGFLAHILPMVRGIQLKQHIVEGDYVATVFDMETVNGVDHVFDQIHIVDGQIKSIHAFYYSEQTPGGQI